MAIPSHYKTSVVIPWHRNTDLLYRSIASIAQQTLNAHEIIIVCNGGAIIDQRMISTEFANLSIKVVLQTEADANKARNTGAFAASGDLIAFLDADDEFLPDRVAIATIHFLRNPECTILCGGGLRRHVAGRTWTFAVTPKSSADTIGVHILSRGNLLLTSSFTVRASVFSRTTFTQGVSKFQDLDFLLNAEAAGEQIQVSGDPLFVYHDVLSFGRLSRTSDFDNHIAWAKDHPHMSEQVRAAFYARAVAQHEFPMRFRANVRRLLNGWTTGKISIISTLAMSARGLIPSRLRDMAFYIYSKARLNRF
jgi:glycosyltransferase involved in cell wall biosynthesis